MSKKHYFPPTNPNTLIPLHLSALLASNPHLTYLPTHRVILSLHPSPSSPSPNPNISLISGGGSGHEPAWASYVGSGLLSAAACGDIFASPSMKQILAAIAATRSAKGTILLITNYTGDKLHFGLAAERARAAMKILGAAAKRGWDFDSCVKLGRACNEQIVSIGSVLDHCHVPGRQNHDEIGDDGAERISPFPSVEDLISKLLRLLCDPNDPERAFVTFNKDDEVVLLINNYGGLSNLELDEEWDIRPVKIYSGCFETSLNGPGFSISLFNVTVAGKNAGTSKIIELLEDPTNAPAWPNVLSNTSTKVERPAAPVIDIEKQAQISANEDIKISPIVLKAAIKLAAERAIAAEPNLTKWDMVMGDGDCGEAVKGVSEATLQILDHGVADFGSIFAILYAIIDAVDDMGGTLGAIFGILLAALASTLKAQKAKGDGDFMDIFAPALTDAVDSLKKHTGARVGDRTVMDVLIPFQETLEKQRDLGEAVLVAENAASGTKDLKPKFGRASYVGAGGDEQKLPDPGAWALMEIVRGVYDASRN
ncbi:hypothetical protein HYFRA_00001709 [Hymenoscyphus fraxineus]|uniref:Dihydroxyacetone kinase n=1 Tax=Hymenoscyphus fraxineus TaxID=746836 RepID=A0A9N9L4D0_9HELO|nr:hypothetical protein HYFRA_00001709 [Hymenoscyphus fraxineus]